MLTTLTRRQFLHALVVSISVPPILSGCLDLNYDKLARKLMRTLARKDIAHKVGKGYVKYIEPGNQLDKIMIIESILKSLPISGNDLKSIQAAPLREVLHQQITIEFSEERVFPVVGWILSETETKLCLLAYALETTQNG